MEKMTELLNQEESGLVQDLRLSFSRISSFDQDGPSALVKRKELSGEGILMGGVIDLLLFEPDKFKDNYYVFTAKEPTAMSKTLADGIIANYTEIPSDKKILEMVETLELWKKITKEELIIAKFDNDDFRGYLKAVFESRNKTIISADDLEKAKEIVEVLKTHPHSKDLVDFPGEDENKYVQLELDFNYKQFAFKGIVDLVIVNHVDKTIKFIDLKTGAPYVQDFSKSFIKYRYYLQAILYSIGAKAFKEKYDLKDYRLLPFEFLYISRTQRIPFIYEVPLKWNMAAVNGFTTTAGYRYKGLDQLLEEIDWHWTHKEFDLPMDMATAQGKIVINDDFIEVNE